MRFLADESCDFAVVRALRATGLDVLAVSEFMQRSDDRELIERANGIRERWIDYWATTTGRRSSMTASPR